jgi:hypothetical protein
MEVGGRVRPAARSARKPLSRFGASDYIPFIVPPGLDRILILIGVLGLVKDDICGNAESDRCENRKNYADWYVEEIEII